MGVRSVRRATRQRCRTGRVVIHRPYYGLHCSAGCCAFCNESRRRPWVGKRVSAGGEFETIHCSFAAGSDYDFLDKLQCTIDFAPARFNVTVNISGRNITVSPLPGNASDIEPTRNLTNTLMRQFELISNERDQFSTNPLSATFLNKHPSRSESKQFSSELGHSSLLSSF